MSFSVKRLCESSACSNTRLFTCAADHVTMRLWAAPMFRWILKGQFTRKWSFCHQLLSLMSFKPVGFLSYFEEHWEPNNIDFHCMDKKHFCVQQNEVSNTGFILRGTLPVLAIILDSPSCLSLEWDSRIIYPESGFWEAVVQKYWSCQTAMKRNLCSKTSQIPFIWYSVHLVYL